MRILLTVWFTAWSTFLLTRIGTMGACGEIGLAGPLAVIALMVVTAGLSALATMELCQADKLFQDQKG